MPPRKKKAKIAKIVNNDKIITGKLMQLSLIMDDHIYKNERISAEDAKIFLRDLVSLKEHIKKNIRLSQVAEKLTREMRGIIAEEQDPLKIDHQDPYNYQSYNNAPQNSPAQYDSPYKSEQKTANKEEEMKQKKVETVIKQMNMFDETKVHKTGVNTDSAKPVHASNDQANEQKTVNKEKEMKQKKVKTVIKQMNKFYETRGQKTSIKIDSAMPVHVSNNQANEQKTVNKEKDMKQKKVKTVIKQMNKFYETRGQKTGIKTDSAMPVHASNNQASEQKTVNKEKKTKQKKVETVLKQTNKFDETKVQQTGINKASAKPVHVLAKEQKRVNKEKEMKLKKVETVIKQMNKFDETAVQKTGMITDLAKPVHVSDDQAKRMPVEIDLSWIEGIKYVRIIDEKEYVPSHESVWDDCEFPKSWNESDFDYY